MRYVAMLRTNVVYCIITNFCLLKSVQSQPGASTSKQLPAQNLARRFAKEYKELQKEAANGIIATPDPKNTSHFNVVMEGPKNSPYEGGYFKLDVDLPSDYPYGKPTAKFKTKVYHPNIRSDSGEICVTILKEDWTPALTISKLLVSIRSLLTDPNPDSPLESEIANTYKKNPKLYESRAREWTEKYAKKDPEPKNAEPKKPEPKKAELDK